MVGVVKRTGMVESESSINTTRWWSFHPPVSVCMDPRIYIFLPRKPNMRALFSEASSPQEIMVEAPQGMIEPALHLWIDRAQI